MILKKTSFFFYYTKKSIFYHRKSNFSVSNKSEAELGGINLASLKIERPLIDQKINGQHYDLAIIGGGSGGLALASEAYKLGLKTILFDYVEPSYQGTQWGIGGTCVNVGCIPKKLMHTAAINAEKIMSSYDYGFNINEVNSYSNPENLIKTQKFFNWKALVQNIQTYIKSMNFGYKSKLINNNIPYVNALASFVDSKTLIFSPIKEIISDYVKTQEIKPENQSKVGKITSNYFVICTGGRPNYLQEKDCINCKTLSITSDDIFSLKKPPNKTLIVGGGYIALECAGFLSGLGYPVSIMTRGLYLRSFDQDISKLILEDLVKLNGVRVIETSLPKIIENTKEGKKKVVWKGMGVKKDENSDTFDTVLFAIGRTPNTHLLNLEKAGVKTVKSKKILGGYGDEPELTSNPNVYAIGDVLEGVPELTPVAQKSAVLICRRIAEKLKGNSIKNLKQHLFLDYSSVPTTIFTPTEYSCVGLSEDKAREIYGKENIEVYHSKFTPLEEYISERIDELGDPLKRKAYCKIITLANDQDKIIGIHYLGQNAGEIMQGLAIAFRKGITKNDLDFSVGIHPTSAEEFVNLHVSKTSGEDFEKKSC